MAAKPVGTPAVSIFTKNLSSILHRGEDSEEAAGQGSNAPVTKALPFTEASLARAIKGVERAGRFVVGVKPDGTLIVGNSPVDIASLVPVAVQNAPASKWEDQRG